MELEKYLAIKYNLVINIKKFHVYIFLLLLITTNLSIFFDIFLMRTILSFICFIILPGLLIIYSMKIKFVDRAKIVLLSLGLSLSFLIFSGLFLNNLSLWLGYSKPLSTIPLTLSLTALILVLGLITYLRNEEAISKINNTSLFSIEFKLKHFANYFCIYGMLMVILLLSIAGRILQDIYDNNIFIIFMFSLIIIYIIFCIIMRVPRSIYPISIYIISVSILLSRSLLSNYLIGGDIYSEFNTFQIVLRNHNWHIDNYSDNVMLSLSVSLLPTLLQNLLGIEPLIIYKAVLILIVALIPVICYAIYEIYLDSEYAFLSSIFYISQVPFIYLLTGQIRVGIALISFMLVFLVLFDTSINNVNKKLLLIIFIFTAIVEYYVIPILLLVLLISLFIIAHFGRSCNLFNSVSFDLFNYSIIFLIAVLIYIWWGQITAGGLYSYVSFSSKILESLWYLFKEEAYSPTVLNLYTISDENMLMLIPKIFLRITTTITFIGIISIILIGKYRRKFSFYSILMLISLMLVIGEFVLPMLSYMYGPDRLYLQLLAIFAPAFIVGTKIIFEKSWSLLRIRNNRHKIGNRLHFERYTIALLICMQLLFTSSLYDQIVGEPGREIMSKDNELHDSLYVHDSEVAAANWLIHNSLDNFSIYMGTILQLGRTNEIFEFTDNNYNKQFEIRYFQLGLKDVDYKNSYVFLRYQNIVTGMVFAPYVISSSGKLSPGSYRGMNLAPLTNYTYLFRDKSLIYNNNVSNIYY